MDFPGQLQSFEGGGLKYGDLIAGLQHKSSGKCYLIELLSIDWRLSTEHIAFFHLSPCWFSFTLAFGKASSQITS